MSQTKYFAIPTKPLTHPEVVQVTTGPDGKQTSKPFEFSFALYIAGLLSDPWWRGTNDNEGNSRADANLRIQDAMEEAESSKSTPHVIALDDADLAWLVERARAYQVPNHLAPFGPKLLRFYKILLTASTTDPRPKPATLAEAAPIAASA